MVNKKLLKKVYNHFLFQFYIKGAKMKMRLSFAVCALALCGGGALNADELALSASSSPAKGLSNQALSVNAAQSHNEILGVKSQSVNSQSQNATQGILLTNANLQSHSSQRLLLADISQETQQNADSTTSQSNADSQSADTQKPKNRRLTSNDDIATFQLDAVNINSVGDEISESGIDEGILNKGVASGPLDNKRVMDVPYQVNTITRELLDNQNIQSFDEAVKYFPSAQLQYRGGGEQGRPQTRGFQGSVVANSFWDGFYTVSTTAIPMAMFESLQVQNGLSGSLYGGQEPSGTFSYQRKRPMKDYNAVWFDFISRGNLGVGWDTSDRFEYVGYRAVLFTTNGEREPANAETQRQLASFALDFYPSETLIFETNFSHYRHIMTGYYGSKSITTKNGVAQNDIPGIGDFTTDADEKFMETTTVSGKFKLTPSPAWYFEGGYQWQRAIRERGSTPDFTLPSAFVKAQTEAQTGVVKHNLTLSANGYQWRMGYGSVSQDMKNLGLLYDIGITEYFDMILSGANSWFYLPDEDYKKSGISWAGSAIIKFTPNFNIYFTYADSLKEGTIHTYDTESGYDTAHPLFGQTIVFKPYRSKSYEVGMKTRVSELDFSLAAFQITRPTYYEAEDSGGNPVFDKQGEQRNRGIELTMGGKIVEPLSVYGGVTLLDAKMHKSANSAVEGKTTVGEPKVQANVLFDFAVPNINKLAFTTNFHYTGERWVDEMNTKKVDDYFTMDLGVRYATRKWIGKETTVRLNVNNVFNEKYIAGMFPGMLDGNLAQKGRTGTSLFRGYDRTIILSGQVKF